MKNYGYIRVSTETQAEKGFGLSTQQDEINKYAQANGLEIEQIFVDAGISGNLKATDNDDILNKREALIEMLAVLQPDDVVIVLNTSRLWRSDMTKAIVRRELMRKKAHIRSLEQPNFDLYAIDRDPNAYLTNAIMEALDVYERMSISLKLARGRMSKAKGGDKPAGICPYGYNYTPDKKHVEVISAEAQTVRKMFSLGQTGVSLQKIADAINVTGALTRHGKPFSKGTIAAILNNRFYVGELTHAGRTIPGNHEPIISKVQFGKVQKQLEQRKRG